MIDDAQLRQLCVLVDEMRLRGVHVIHVEKGDMKLEFHVNSLAPGELPRSSEVKDRMLEDPATTPEQPASPSYPPRRPAVPQRGAMREWSGL